MVRPSVTQAMLSCEPIAWKTRSEPAGIVLPKIWMSTFGLTSWMRPFWKSTMVPAGKVMPVIGVTSWVNSISSSLTGL